MTALVPFLVVGIAEDDTVGAGKNVVAGASLNIIKSGGGAASIYADEAGTTPISLPTTLDSSGQKMIFIAAGAYDVVIGGVSRRQDITGVHSSPFVVETFSALATTAAPTAGMIVYLKQHTSGGLGGGHFQDTAGTITNNGGTLINNLVTSGRHWKRIDCRDTTPQMFGVVNAGDESALAAVFANYISANGGVASLPHGEYIFDDIQMSYTSGKNYKFLGDGPEKTIIKPSTSGVFAIEFNASTGTIFSNTEISNFMIFMLAGRNGMRLFSASYFDLHNITFYGGSVGLRVESVLSSSLRRCVFYGCETGVETLIGGGFSGHNAMQYDKCDWTLNSFRGFSGGPVDVISVTNGQCQYNGTMGDSSSGGLSFAFNSVDPECGLTMSNMYFEYNKGGFDLSITNSGTAVATHTITNCQFFRFGTSDFTTNNIFATGKNRIILINCTFSGFGGYSPSAGRPYFNVGPDTEVICIGCNFGSLIEQGSYRNSQITDQNMLVVDQKSTGVSGGASVVGMQDRDINTVIYNTIPSASLLFNVVTIPPGVYRVTGRAPAFACGKTQAFIFDTTLGFVCLGTSEEAVSGGASIIDDMIAITATSNYKLVQHCQSVAASGLGAASASGQPERYSYLKFTRIATL